MRRLLSAFSWRADWCARRRVNTFVDATRAGVGAMQMKSVLRFAAAAEVATGAALLVVPSIVGRVLLGASLSGVAVPVACVAGIALVALGIACWGRPSLGMLIYSAAVALYLAVLGFTGGATGVLLWPAVVVHVVLAALLARASSSMRARGGSRFHRVGARGFRGRPEWSPQGGAVGSGRPMPGPRPT